MGRIKNKIISLILCLAVFSSVLTIGFTAFATDEKETKSYSSVFEVLGDIGEKMNSFSFKINKKHTLKAFADYVGNVDYFLQTANAFMQPLKEIPRLSQYNNAGDTATKVLYNLLNVLSNQLLDVICALFPTPDYVNIEDYDSANFLSGHSTLLTTPAQGASWKVGYANASVIPSDFAAGQYFMGGSLNIKQRYATEVLDDMKIRVTSYDDGSGRGAVIMAVVDNLGISSYDVRQVRALLADYAKQNNIASINISATHTHSAIDMQGFGSPFISSVVWNAFSEEYGVGKTTSGRNEKFMNNFYNVSANAIKKAFSGMKTGKLYYSVGDISQFVKDKEYPDVVVKEAACLRFVPNDGSEGTYIVNMTCHPTTLSHTTTTQVSSDFIYYMEKTMNEAGYNLLYLQGAVGNVTKSTETIDMPQNATRIDTMTYFGRALGNYFLGLKSKEVELKPVINAKHMEFMLECDNNLLMLAVKSQILNNIIVRTGDGLSTKNFKLMTETGYVTFGDKVMFGLMPCEMYPEVSIGGAPDAEHSWSNTEWDSECLKDCVNAKFDYYTVCFANDTYGYVMTDTDYAFLKVDSPADTLLSAGARTASQTVNAFKELLAIA